MGNVQATEAENGTENTKENATEKEQEKEMAWEKERKEQVNKRSGWEEKMKELRRKQNEYRESCEEIPLPKVLYFFMKLNANNATNEEGKEQGNDEVNVEMICDKGMNNIVKNNKICVWKLQNNRLSCENLTWSLPEYNQHLEIRLCKNKSNGKMHLFYVDMTCVNYLQVTKLEWYNWHAPACFRSLVCYRHELHFSFLITPNIATIHVLEPNEAKLIIANIKAQKEEQVKRAKRQEEERHVQWLRDSGRRRFNDPDYFFRHHQSFKTSSIN